jgi:hypothetical protein
LGWYHDVEAALPIREASEYRGLVVPNGNTELPIHRWFHLKEAFSAELLPALLEDLELARRPQLAILDAFVGSGTTVQSARTWAREHPSILVRADGIERNRFLALVASCKVSASTQQAPRLARAARRIVDTVRRGLIDPTRTPALSTFSNTAYFPPGVLRELLELKAAINRFSTEQDVRALLLLALGAVVEPASRLRRDGRALRHERSKQPQSPVALFEATTEMFTADLAEAPTPGNAFVYNGDGRRPALEVGSDARYQLALFSPPYINNIDYTEIYKLEAWLLGLVNSQLEFREQRRLTMRSHPSVRFASALPGRESLGPQAFDRLLAPVLAAVPETPDRNWRRRLIVEYFDDLGAVLLAHSKLLDPDSYLACVIGNSVHGGRSAQFVVAADLLAALLAQHAGYQVVSLGIARRATRAGRSLPFARESVLVLAPRAR